MTFQEIQIPIHLQSYGPPRTPGLHLSQILRAMAIHTKVFKDSVDLGELFAITDPLLVGLSGPMMRAIMGYAWENWVFTYIVKNALRGTVEKPLEFFLDGVIGTPDGIEEDEQWLTIHESKWTFLSSVGPFSSRLTWLYQGACYMKMVAAKYQTPISQCRLIYHPCYVKGNYRGIDTEYRPVEVRLEEREVNGVWDEVSRHRNLVLKEEGC